MAQSEEVALMDLKKDLVCSPIAVLMPLAKIALGADDKALTELETGLGFIQADISSKVNEIISKLVQIDGIELTLISKIYISKNMNLMKHYKSQVQQIFRTKLEYIDFQYKHSASIINKWVKSKTDGKIKDIVTKDDLKNIDSLLMISVINFEATWYKRFDLKLIKTFYSPKGKVQVPMMGKKDILKYIESKVLKSKIICIPYKGFEAELVIVLPKSHTGLESMLKILKRSGMTVLKDIMYSMTMESVEISIPIFKTETTLDLESILRSININEIFTTGVSEMVFDKMMIVNKAIQKTYIKIDQDGTSASSASAFEFQLLSAMVQPKTFDANHPFLYIVVAKGEQLFAGVYNGIKVDKASEYIDDEN